MLVLDGVEMLDVREIAGLAERTPETVRRWIWSGRLPARTHGRKLLVARRDVERLLAPADDLQASSLADWASSVVQQRQADARGPAPRARTAADLVIANRTRRQAG